ncbi:MAG: exodeoxyribonuclease VII large subunit, partial [Myxococcales bacterium]|nr:exodeoxyribonuclease VII large subunit [Myxococcales bacterium]
MASMPLFDRIPEGGEPAAESVLTVGALNRSVRARLEDEWGDLWVEGELSDVSRPRSGHIYFTLNDPEAAAQVRGVLFRGDAVRIQ